MSTLATLVLLLARFERLNESFLSTVCRRHGVSSAELRVLAMLEHRVDDRVASPSLLAEWIVQTSGGLTATLRRLEDAGFVERVEDPADGRGRLVALTDEGSARYRAVLDDLTRQYEAVLGELDHEEALEVVRSLVGAFESHEGLSRTGHWMVGSPSMEASR